MFSQCFWYNLLLFDKYFVITVLVSVWCAIHKTSIKFINFRSIIIVFSVFSINLVRVYIGAITNYQLSNYQLPIMHNITAESTVTTSSRLIISYQRIEQTNKSGKIFSSVLNQSTQTLAFTC